MNHKHCQKSVNSSNLNTECLSIVSISFGVDENDGYSIRPYKASDKYVSVNVCLEVPNTYNLSLSG